MLMRSCNVADPRPHFRYLAPKPLPYSRNIGVAAFSCSSRPAPELDLSVSGGAARPAGSGRLADRLRLGRLTEDGLSFKENFIVRCYEVGVNKTATVETIANLMQVRLPMHFRNYRHWFSGDLGVGCCWDLIL